METNNIHTAWDCIGRDLAKLWCRIPAIWSMPARGSLCEGLSLAINQSDRYCLSLEQDHAQVVGWQGWDSLCTHWSLKAKSSEMAESRLPPLPAWPETWGTLICLMVLFSFGRKLWCFVLKAGGPNINYQSIQTVSDAAKGRAQGIPLPHVLVEQMGVAPNCFSSNWRILFYSNVLLFFFLKNVMKNF